MQGKNITHYSWFKYVQVVLTQISENDRPTRTATQPATDHGLRTTAAFRGYPTYRRRRLRRRLYHPWIMMSDDGHIVHFFVKRGLQSREYLHIRYHLLPMSHSTPGQFQRLSFMHMFRMLDNTMYVNQYTTVASLFDSQILIPILRTSETQATSSD